MPLDLFQEINNVVNSVKNPEIYSTMATCEEGGFLDCIVEPDVVIDPL